LAERSAYYHLRIRRGQYKHGGVWQHWFWSRVVFILPPLFGRLGFNSSISAGKDESFSTLCLSIGIAFYIF